MPHGFKNTNTSYRVCRVAEGVDNHTAASLQPKRAHGSPELNSKFTLRSVLGLEMYLHLGKFPDDQRCRARLTLEVAKV